MQSQSTETLKSIANCHSFQQYLEISQQSIIECLKQHFPEAINLKIQEKVRDHNFYGNLKKLAQVYENFVCCLNSFSKNQHSELIDVQIKQKEQNYHVDLPSRKNTRATFAMRNSKNQQQLKKDQIFVRVIPRTHNCIHFMVKNHNFPRIQCRLSCNQHLQYLVTYLTNKWLRGKVGVGYQIKLYPDPSTYMHKHSNEGKRPNIIHEPLNNYLMFTDIMAAFGVAQNGCINLLYDVTQMRKQKQKFKVTVEKQSPSKNTNNYQIRILKTEIQEKCDNKMIQTPLKKEIKKAIQSSSHNRFQYRSYRNQHQLQYDQDCYYKKHGQGLNNQKQSENEEPKLLHQNLRDILDNQDQVSIGLHKDRKSYLGNNSIDYSEVNSLGYHFNNGFSSNHLLGNLFNMNNSNTFLNIYENTQRINPIQNAGPEKHEQKIIQSVNQENKHYQNVCLNSQPLPNSQDKLESIRNIISFVEKEADQFGKCGEKHQDIVQQRPLINNQDYLGLSKIEKQKDKEVSLKKQVKTVTIIKKKNQSAMFE